mmetsp:Transcript_32492/g.100559  ORF Transcript_32492/g.100559 Transcript_32492/m.100559 type:complete len:236 (+) Transcript_32492:557-1264(+)
MRASARDKLASSKPGASGPASARVARQTAATSACCSKAGDAPSSRHRRKKSAGATTLNDPAPPRRAAYVRNTSLRGCWKRASTRTNRSSGFGSSVFVLATRRADRPRIIAWSLDAVRSRSGSGSGAGAGAFLGSVLRFCCVGFGCVDRRRRAAAAGAGAGAGAASGLMERSTSQKSSQLTVRLPSTPGRIFGARCSASFRPRACARYPTARPGLASNFAKATPFLFTARTREHAS